MPYNPTTTDITRDARVMLLAISRTVEYMNQAGREIEANYMADHLGKMSVRMLAALLHFTITPER